MNCRTVEFQLYKNGIFKNNQNTMTIALIMLTSFIIIKFTPDAA